MNEVIRKTNNSGSCLPIRLVIYKNDITSEIDIANEFNKFFANIGPELARKISTESRTSRRFLSKIDTALPGNPITINELKETFFP